MSSINATNARQMLYQLIRDVNDNHEPITITGKKGDAVLISADDWRSIQETLHLLSIPGMRESIREGLDTPPEACSEDPGW